MPYARVLLSPRVSEARIRILEEELPAILAEELSVASEEPLTASDITIDGETTVQGGGSIPMFRPRVLEGDVAIIVFGNNFPTRVEQKDEIARRIGGRVTQLLLPGLKAYVWLLLCEGGFYSFRT